MMSLHAPQSTSRPLTRDSKRGDYRRARSFEGHRFGVASGVNHRKRVVFGGGNDMVAIGVADNVCDVRGV